MHLFNSCVTMLPLVRTLGISNLKSERSFVRKREVAPALRELTMGGNVPQSLPKGKKVKISKAFVSEEVQKRGGGGNIIFKVLFREVWGGAGVEWRSCSFQVERKYSVQDVVNAGNSV